MVIILSNVTFRHDIANKLFFGVSRQALGLLLPNTDRIQ